MSSNCRTDLQYDSHLMAELIRFLVYGGEHFIDPIVFQSNSFAL